jgi:hypothetical protein
LVSLLVSAIWLRGGVYEFVLNAQLIFYGLAGVRLLGGRAGLLSRVSSIPLTFVVLNAAAALAFCYAMTGRKVLWARQPK